MSMGWPQARRRIFCLSMLPGGSGSASGKGERRDVTRHDTTRPDNEVLCKYPARHTEPSAPPLLRGSRGGICVEAAHTYTHTHTHTYIHAQGLVQSAHTYRESKGQCMPMRMPMRTPRAQCVGVGTFRFCRRLALVVVWSGPVVV